MNTTSYRLSRNWQRRNKLMALTLLLSEMDMYDTQACDSCPYCSNHGEQDADNVGNLSLSSSNVAHSTPNVDSLQAVKVASEIKPKITLSGVREQLTTIKLCQESVASTSNKYDCSGDKALAKENVWLLQEPLSRPNSASASVASSDTDSGHLTGSESNDYVTAQCDPPPTSIVLKVSSV